MVRETAIVFIDVIVDNLAVGPDERHTYALQRMALDIGVDGRLTGVAQIMKGLVHAPIEVLEFVFQQTVLILLLSILLENDEGHGIKQKNAQDTQIEPLSYRYLFHQASK
jgi:hypothetical protein